MPFEIGEVINASSDAFLRAPIVLTTVSSPVYTALMITFIIMLIIMFVFRDADTEDSLIVMALRSGFWSFLVTLTIIFLHNKILTREVAACTRDSAMNNVYNSNIVPSGVNEDAFVPVPFGQSAPPMQVRDMYAPTRGPLSI